MEQPSSPRDNDSPRYEAVLPRDGINNPPENMLRRFFINIGLVAGIVVLFLVVLNLVADVAGPYVPFSWERRLVGEGLLASHLTGVDAAREREIRRIGRRVVAASDLPDGMDVRFFYKPSAMQNAFATLGGNVIVLSGLLDVVESEDGLAMVLAHEVMHVKHRDAMRGLLKGMGWMLLSLGVQGGGFVDGVMRVGMTGYSRDQEMRADAGAVAVLGRLYGHAAGAEEFFRNLAERIELRPVDSGASERTALVSSHPDTIMRLERTKEEAARLGLRPDGRVTPLAGVFADRGDAR